MKKTTLLIVIIKCQIEFASRTVRSFGVFSQRYDYSNFPIICPRDGMVAIKIYHVVRFLFMVLLPLLMFIFLNINDSEVLIVLLVLGSLFLPIIVASLCSILFLYISMKNEVSKND